jgi:hypothetical protein
LIDGAFPFDEFISLKGKLGLFSVELQLEIIWDEPAES